MSLDPSAQLTLQFIQNLGNQISQGIAKGREQRQLDRLLPQIQQGQDPEAILQSILEAQLNQDLSQQTKQNIANVGSQFAGLAKSKQTLSAKTQKEQQEKLAAAQELSRRTGNSAESYMNLPISSLNALLQADLTGEKTVAAENAKSNIRLANEIRAGSRKAKSRMNVISQLEELGNKNQTGPINARRFFSLFGAPDIGENPTQGAISTARAFLLDFVKETFGGRLNQTEVQLIEKTIPNVNDKPAVFKAKIEIWKKMIQEASKGGDIINKIIKDSGGKVPSDKDIGFLYDEAISNAKDEIFNAAEALNIGKEQINEPSLLDDPRIADIVAQLRSAGLTDQQILEELTK